MPKFSQWSKDQLATCHPDLQRLFNRVILQIDCRIIKGHKGEEEQNNNYHMGFSKLQYPHSKHNSDPSMAADVAPCPIDWNDWDRFYYFAGMVKGVASEMGIHIRHGLDWDGDNILDDQTFFDAAHFELI